MKRHRLILSEPDRASLESILEESRKAQGNDAACVRALEDAIDTAEIRKTGAMPTNVVRIHSQVYVHDLDSGEEAAYTLVLPGHADIDRRRVSVLAPIGAALLGRRAGEIVTPVTPNGRRRRLRVGAIVREQVAVSAA